MSVIECTYIETGKCICKDPCCELERAVQECYDSMQACEMRHSRFSGTEDEEAFAYQRFLVEMEQFKQAWHQARERRNSFYSKPTRDSN